MQKTRILVLVLSCEATRDRREACLETWMQHKQPASEIVPVFVVGRPGRGPSLAGDVLYVDCPDSYAGLPLKTWGALREAFSRWDFDWVMKTDDDSLVNLYRLRHYPLSHDYIGARAGKHGLYPWSHAELVKRELISEHKPLARPEFSYAPWADGCGYILSRHAAALIAREPIDYVYRESCEDRFVGNVLYGHGIQLHGDHSGFRGAINGTNLEENLLGAVVLHPLSAEMMRRVYWRLTRAGEMIT